MDSLEQKCISLSEKVDFQCCFCLSENFFAQVKTRLKTSLSVQLFLLELELSRLNENIRKSTSTAKSNAFSKIFS